MKLLSAVQGLNMMSRTIYLLANNGALVWSYFYVVFNPLSLGYYAVLVAENKYKDNNKVGELISSAIRTPNNDKCVVFYYMMNGASITHLQIFVRVNNKYFKLWHKVGHQGNYWQRGAFSLPKSDVKYYVSV